MSLQQFIGSSDERILRQYDYDDGTVIVADLGVADEDATVEVLDDVALVVVEVGGETEQAEIPLPDGGSAKAFINNGVVTIEVRE
jgi:HSP20 family molecular chaperone IbpA